MKAKLDSTALSTIERQARGCEEVVASIETCVAQAVLDTNTQLQADDRQQKLYQWMGSTAVICLMYKQHVWVANAGDSRAVCCRAGRAADLTHDHKASCPLEAARVVSEGGQVINNSGPRLMGVLAVTRALGDLALTNYGLIARPDTCHFDRTEDDEFLILATDGLWDVLSSQEAVDLVRRVFLKVGVSDGGDSSVACRVAASVLTRVALVKNSRDNITAVVVDLRPPSHMPLLAPTAPLPSLRTLPQPPQPASPLPPLSAASYLRPSAPLAEPARAAGRAASALTASRAAPAAAAAALASRAASKGASAGATPSLRQLPLAPAARPLRLQLPLVQRSSSPASPGLTSDFGRQLALTRPDSRTRQRDEAPAGETELPESPHKRSRSYTTPSRYPTLQHPSSHLRPRSHPAPPSYPSLAIHPSTASPPSPASYPGLALPVGFPVHEQLVPVPGSVSVH